jgi:hypothetical protein
MDSLIHNMQQYAGIITNMFLSPVDQFAEYSASNITELEKVEPAAEGEDSKNA